LKLGQANSFPEVIEYKELDFIPKFKRKKNEIAKIGTK
jgi:hypothetical protein